ncbi:purine-nucleoside phosphorylase [Phorcysia thermohydrogeniphila]|uniref:purine-nucleoside phosphorylase n=1 Tax=Phorcysia thermohydrogeniphila TaxID=936138 RepID=A0A4R1G7C4_9BACT|nr:purine-nucleoside phosphorylase [Phorcysia thermohydrogeniphila]TCK03428.1 purine-nucleoside phosphorylase [Phorcysia thermohydrogeniphila]
MKAAEFIKRETGIEEFDIAVVGGSGIDLGSSFIEIPYSEIPGMPETAVPGHQGTLKVTEIGGKKVLLFQGRFHYYEGRTDEEIRFIPFLASCLGAKVFIPTCASGAISRRAASAEIGVVVDHINLMGRNPLTGLISSFGDKVFLNAKTLYDRELSTLFLKTGLELGIKVVSAVLAATLGPNYETFAEIRFLELAGADCVSMSTVPDALAAAFYGMKVGALTIFTNDALKPEASHQEVLEVSSRRSEKLSKLLRTAIRNF